MAALLLRRLGTALLRPAVRGEAAVLALHSGPHRRPGQKAWDEEDEEEVAQDWEQEADGLDQQEVQRLLKRQKKAILFQKMKRQMGPCGPPARRLTWVAMEQIRQLNQEFPEEWTVLHLAEGFNVDSDVIRRVLRSKFSPPLAIRMKQDAKVTMKLENRSISQDSVKDVRRLNSSENVPQVRIQPGKEQQQKRIAVRHTFKDISCPNTVQLPASTSSTVMVTQRKGVTPQKSSRTQERLLAVGKQSHQVKSGCVPLVPSLTLPNIHDSETDKQLSSCQEDEEWDGEILSEQEVERLSESGYKSQMKVVQKGREFFDGNGNFLYSI